MIKSIGKLTMIVIMATILLSGMGIAEEQNVTVTTHNVAPVIEEISVSETTLAPGTQQEINVTVTDLNGEDTINSVNVTIWLPTIGEQGDEDWDSYVLANGTWDNVETLNVTTNKYIFTVDISRHAHYTNATLGMYQINATAEDDEEATGTMQIDGFNVSTRIGIVLDTLTLTVEGTPGTDNVAFNENPQNITHDGNIEQDILINGTDLEHETEPDIIGVGNIAYLDEDNSAGAYELSTTAENVTELSPMSRGTHPTPTVEEIYYWLDIPTATKAGDYTGTITLTVQ